MLFTLFFVCFYSNSYHVTFGCNSIQGGNNKILNIEY